MNTKKEKASIFDILKQGTSFRDRDSVAHQITKPKAVKNKIEAQKKAAKESKVIEDSESEVEEEGFFTPNTHVEGEEDEAEHSKAENRRRDRMLKLVKQLKIKFEGDDVPYPVTNFTKMQKRGQLQDFVVKRLRESGFTKPTPIQMQAFPVLMNDRNVIAIAPTGSGKTLAYILPLYAKLKEHQVGGLRAVIFVPTLELADQIYRDFLYFNNGVENHLHVKQIHSVSTEVKTFKEQMQNYDVLITTPLKFIKLFKRDLTLLDCIKYVIIDEVDRYFELGFLNQINQILKFFEDKTCIFGMFSATIHPVVEDVITNFLPDPIKIIIGGKNNVLKSIDQSLQYCSTEFGKLIAIKELINSGGFVPPVLIFVQSKERGSELHDQLKGQNIKYATISSVQSKEEREEIVLNFRLGKIWALITTDLMCRGIDFKGINLVINYDLPQSGINYIHRVGRTGRAGRSGKAITFFTDVDKPMLRSIANVLKISGCNVPEWILKLKLADKKVRDHNQKYAIQRESISESRAYHIEDSDEERRRMKAKYSKFSKGRKKVKKQQDDGDEEFEEEAGEYEDDEDFEEDDEQ